ncbi:MAG: hypothetical protein ACJ74L_08265 [Gaiellaceae bacterium]
MPTKKQRRRHQKSRRHDYEYVYVDGEGNEVDVDPSELRAKKEETKTETRARGNGKRAPTKSTGRRGIEPPSWRRAGKRGLIFGPVLVVAMVLLNGNNATLAEQVAPAVFLILFFIPFSYFTDSLAYRMHRKRLDRQNAAKTR